MFSTINRNLAIDKYLYILAIYYTCSRNFEEKYHCIGKGHTNRRDNEVNIDFIVTYCQEYTDYI